MVKDVTSGIVVPSAKHWSSVFQIIFVDLMETTSGMRSKLATTPREAFAFPRRCAGVRFAACFSAFVPGRGAVVNCVGGLPAFQTSFGVLIRVDTSDRAYVLTVASLSAKPGPMTPSHGFASMEGLGLHLIMGCAGAAKSKPAPVQRATAFQPRSVAQGGTGPCPICPPSAMLQFLCLTQE
jgi:hypothetical protein